MIGLRSQIYCIVLGAGLAGALLLDQQHILTPSSSHIRDDNAKEVLKELNKAEIIPTVLDVFAPTHSLEIKWSSHSSASLGNTLKPKKLQDAPAVTLSPFDSTSCKTGMTYTVTATDPDAPSRDDPKWSEVCHWIATGLSASSSDGNCDAITLTDLKDVMPYKPPGPPEKTGKHRYVFIAFAPVNGTTDPIHPTKPGDRQNWGTGKERHGVRGWAKENGLAPVAANFIYAQHKKQ